MPKHPSPAYGFAYTALYIDLPIAVICHELSWCGHLLVEINREVRAEGPTGLFAYTIRALVIFLLHRNVPVQPVRMNRFLNYIYPDKDIENSDDLNFAATQIILSSPIYFQLCQHS